MVLHLAVPRLALRGRGDARGKAAPPPAIVARHPLRRRRRRLLLRRAFARRLFRRLLSLLSRRLRERRSRRFGEIDRLCARDRRLRIPGPRASRPLVSPAPPRLAPSPPPPPVRRRGGHARPPPLERPRARRRGERGARRRPARHLRSRRPRRRRRKQPPGFRDERERGDRLPQPRVVREHPAPGVGERRARPRARRQRRTRVERPGEVRPIANLRRENPSDQEWFSGGALNPYAPLSSSGAADPFFGGAAGASLGEEGVARVVAASPLSRERFVIVGPHAREAPERGVRREPPPGLPGAHRPQRVPLVREQAAPEARRRLPRGVAEEATRRRDPRQVRADARAERGWGGGSGRRRLSWRRTKKSRSSAAVIFGIFRVAGVLTFRGAHGLEEARLREAREDGAQRLIRDAAEEGPRGGGLRGDGLARARAPRRRGRGNGRERGRDAEGIEGTRGVATRRRRGGSRSLGAIRRARVAGLADARVVAFPADARERPHPRASRHAAPARVLRCPQSRRRRRRGTTRERPPQRRGEERVEAERREEDAPRGGRAVGLGVAQVRGRGLQDAGQGDAVSRAHGGDRARALCAPAMNRRAAALWRFRGGLDVSSRNDERGRGSIEGGSASSLARRRARGAPRRRPSRRPRRR